MWWRYNWYDTASNVLFPVSFCYGTDRIAIIKKNTILVFPTSLSCIHRRLWWDRRKDWRKEGIHHSIPLYIRVSTRASSFFFVRMEARTEGFIPFFEAQQSFSDPLLVIEENRKGIIATCRLGVWDTPPCFLLSLSFSGAILV